jgi:hypothetical protein
MSAAWDFAKGITETEKSQKRLIRLWMYLSIGGCFLVYVAYTLRVNPF